jgi:hypothetical protein
MPLGERAGLSMRLEAEARQVQQRRCKGHRRMDESHKQRQPTQLHR